MKGKVIRNTKKGEAEESTRTIFSINSTIAIRRLLMPKERLVITIRVL